ncbi:hypothetical protein KIN20_006402 [Parelaphostrongylus tenuis]|uniref:Uncharacterized protein n=1 Tax=Parelaphostrongylus tenuis TaxID=148309 RepID=A0AAD5QFY1_PARTN|nr:hypothetical protein KIN20_006402 [Parelaphostrongylus tenuis]
MVLPELCYAAETWANTSTTSRLLRATHRAFERCLLKFTRRLQRLAGLHSSDLQGLFHLIGSVVYTYSAKHRWVGRIFGRTDGQTDEKSYRVDFTTMYVSPWTTIYTLDKSVRKRSKLALLATADVFSDHGIILAPAARIKLYYCHGRPQPNKGTDGLRAGIRTTSEFGLPK